MLGDAFCAGLLVMTPFAASMTELVPFSQVRIWVEELVAAAGAAGSITCSRQTIAASSPINRLTLFSR
jgi:hypothetical protein